MKSAVKLLAGLLLILAGLFLYLPSFAGIPCLGWYRDLLVLVKGSLGGVLLLMGLVFFAIARE